MTINRLQWEARHGYAYPNIIVNLISQFDYSLKSADVHTRQTGRYPVYEAQQFLLMNSPSIVFNSSARRRTLSQCSWSLYRVDSKLKNLQIIDCIEKNRSQLNVAIWS